MTEAAKRIWVVDDEPDVLAYLVAALEDVDYTVRGFEQPEGVLEAARADPPDLICLDILMPEESGLSLYKAMRKEPALGAIPIVIVSGYSKQEEFVNGEFRRLIGDATTPPPNGFVEKPVALPAFLTLVNRLLQSAGDESALG